MTDRPIIFSAPMVRALLAGRKTQTRRILKPQPEPMPGVSDRFHLSNAHGGIVNATEGEVREHGPDFGRFAVGDRLYVRENHAVVPSSAYRMSEGVQQTVNPADRDEAAIYAAGWDRSKPRWRPSIHMPRWASRLTLLVTDVRVERLNDISEADARAEGVQPICDHGVGNQHLHSIAFQQLWCSLHGDGAWIANPWIVAVTFTVHAGNIDQLPALPATDALAAVKAGEDERRSHHGAS